MNVAFLPPVDTAKVYAPFRLVAIGTRGLYETLIDEADAPLLQHNWNPIQRRDYLEGAVYARRNIGAQRWTVYLHYEVMRRCDRDEWERFRRTHVVDHINGQTLDNRRANLRWATYRENRLNCRGLRAIPSIEMLVSQLTALAPAETEIPW